MYSSVHGTLQQLLTNFFFYKTDHKSQSIERSQLSLVCVSINFKSVYIDGINTILAVCIIINCQEIWVAIFAVSLLVVFIDGADVFFINLICYPNLGIQLQCFMIILDAITSFQKGQSQFKQIFGPQQRWKKHLTIVKDNPDRISAVIQPEPKSNIKFKKPYILLGLQRNCLIGELLQRVRPLVNSDQRQSLFIHCGKILPGTHEKIRNYEKFIEADGFLYFIVSEQQAFG